LSLAIRRAEPRDAATIVELIGELAAAIGETSPLDEQYLSRYLAFPGSHVLVAEQDREGVGMVAFSVRPNLYHAADSTLIEELDVHAPARGLRVGRALVRAVLQFAEELGCAEVSVPTALENQGALRLYRKEGLTEESVLLEKHM
jgi:GNAT superfamily N-acetyltransferase